jgi:1,2-diacylglycerol 3-beta-glucosyltransferase
MIVALQALTVAILLGWPIYNLVIAALALRATRGPARSPEGAGAIEFWIMIPALNEAKVIGNTVTAALALGSGDTPVRVLVIDDGSDDETPHVLADIKDPRLHLLRRDLPFARQGKGEALNAGYRRIRAIAQAAGRERTTIVGVIDGDGRGQPGMLRSVGALFADRRVGAVQCRVRIHNRHRILGLLQDIEFSCVANASQSLRDRMDSVGMGGNGQFVRLADLIRLGESPWSSCLVEDLELGLRLHLSGVSIRYTSTASTSQQAVVDPRRLLRQRTRWAQGNLQCARYVRQLSASRHIGSFGLLDFLYYLVAPWLTVPLTLFVIAAMTIAIVGLTTGETFGGLMAGRSGVEWALTIWIIALFVPGLLWGLFHWSRIGDEPLWRCVLAGLCYPAFLVLGVLATWRAVARHLAGRNAWVKTERVDDVQGGEALAAQSSPT